MTGLTDSFPVVRTYVGSSRSYIQNCIAVLSAQTEGKHLAQVVSKASYSVVANIWKIKKEILSIALKLLLKLRNITSQAEHDLYEKHKDSFISKYINGAGATSGDVRIINVKPTKCHSAMLYYTFGLYWFDSLNKWLKINSPQRREICLDISKFYIDLGVLKLKI